MPFSVSLVQPSDVPTLAVIQWTALRSNPLIQTLYPQGPTAALLTFTSDNYRNALRFPSVRLIKAVDEESGETVGFAKWIAYPEEEHLLNDKGRWEKETNLKGMRSNAKQKDEGIPRPEGVDEKTLVAWNAIITDTRHKIMKSMRHDCELKGGCSLECYFSSIAPALWVLDIIHTHPSHQSRGIGTLLLSWGADRADKRRMQCYVESSPAGYALFHKHDFEYITEMKIDLNRYKRHQYHYDQDYKHFIMIRPPDPPPTVPPKDLDVTKPSNQRESVFGLLDSHSSGGSGYGIRRKASLIEIKRSPRFSRSLRLDLSESSPHSGSVPSSAEREMGIPSPGAVERIIDSYKSWDP